MSFSPFGQIAGDNTSEPPTPLSAALEGYSPWDATIERDHEEQQQQQQHSQQQEHFSQYSPPVQPIPIRTIQFQDQHPLEFSGPSPSPDGHGIVDTTPISLHPPHLGSTSAEGSSSSVSGFASKPPPPQLPASGLRRSARAQRSKPYTRPQSVAAGSGRLTHTTSTAAAGPSSRLDTGKYKEKPPQQPQQFRFVNMRVPASQSAASSSMPSPASTSGNFISQGSIAGSPVAAPSSRQQSVVPHERYPIFPTPKPEDLTLNPESLIRERKFGEFSRSFAVPAHLKSEDVVTYKRYPSIELDDYRHVRNKRQLSGLRQEAR
ncbi:hypothetical protein Agabi119p4_9385 [Agaricus bisporus var. burnettii]|uniref:Uncharacterized protein n=1 Tax=Agaricus bisporus var. burnettii TaxID=192524 RepID=A0A8H7EWL2_AGABI|nr:hypothetical protein Agabi119p4_9385 [Agaricus bisporus var. burnettii]